MDIEYVRPMWQSDFRLAMSVAAVQIVHGRSKAHHNTLVARTADNRREHSTRRIIASKASLHHAGAIVAHQRGHFPVFGLRNTSAA